MILNIRLDLVYCLCVLLLVQSTRSVPSMAATATPEAPFFDTSGFVKALFRGESTNSKSQGASENVMVIGAGYQRTSTASFTTALSRLGLKSYHMKELLNSAEHLRLWYDYAQHQLQTNSSDVGDDDDDTALDALLTQLSLDGYNATTDAPTCQIYKPLLKKYPDAMVVLTIRDNSTGTASTDWARSFQSTVGRVLEICSRAPLKWIPNAKRFEVLHRWIAQTQNMPQLAATSVSSFEEVVQSYESWIQQVQATVPANQLLLFSANQGYQPLCDFLSPLDDIIREHCEDILASGEAYPHVNDSSVLMRVITFFLGVASVCENIPWLCLALGCLCVICKVAGKLLSSQHTRTSDQKRIYYKAD